MFSFSIVDRWQRFEREDKERIKRNKQELNYRKTEQQLEKLEETLDRERKARGILTVASQPSPRLVENFGGDLSHFMDTFNIVEGVTPLRVEPSTSNGKWGIRTEDGRTLSSLSSGQKAQLAIAMIFALNSAIHNLHYFDVMAFDDFTSALDLSQIPGLAGLLRRVAYSAGTGSEIKKQLFIVSHHEDFTNKLLDFMLPPQGMSMRILDYRGWSQKEGPIIEELIVNEGGQADAVKEDLKFILDERLFKSYNHF